MIYPAEIGTDREDWVGLQLYIMRRIDLFPSHRPVVMAIRDRFPKLGEGPRFGPEWRRGPSGQYLLNFIGDMKLVRTRWFEHFVGRRA